MRHPSPWLVADAGLGTKVALELILDSGSKMETSSMNFSQDSLTPNITASAKNRSPSFLSRKKKVSPLMRNMTDFHPNERRARIGFLRNVQLREGWRYQIGWIFKKVPKGRGVIFNPKIYVTDFEPFNSFFWTFSEKNVWNFSENSSILVASPVPNFASYMFFLFF